MTARQQVESKGWTVHEGAEADTYYGPENVVTFQKPLKDRIVSMRWQESACTETVCGWFLENLEQFGEP